MGSDNTNVALSQNEPAPEKPEWYEYWLNLFKKLLEFNQITYGTKKKF